MVYVLVQIDSTDTSDSSCVQMIG